MNNILGLAIFALGIVLLIFGLGASQSFNSEITPVVTSSSQSAWLVIGGALSVILGLYVAIRCARTE